MWGDENDPDRTDPAEGRAAEPAKPDGGGGLSSAEAYAQEKRAELEAQIGQIKKASPWLGNLIHKATLAQSQRKIGQPVHPVPGPARTIRRFIWLIVILVVLSFFGPFIMGAVMMLAGG